MSYRKEYNQTVARHESKESFEKGTGNNVDGLAESVASHVARMEASFLMLVNRELIIQDNVRISCSFLVSSVSE